MRGLLCRGGCSDQSIPLHLQVRIIWPGCVTDGEEESHVDRCRAQTLFYERAELIEGAGPLRRRRHSTSRLGAKDLVTILDSKRRSGCRRRSLRHPPCCTRRGRRLLCLQNFISFLIHDRRQLTLDRLPSTVTPKSRPIHTSGKIRLRRQYSRRMHMNVDATMLCAIATRIMRRGSACRHHHNIACWLRVHMPVMSYQASVTPSQVVLCDVMPGRRPSVCAAGMAGPLGWERRVEWPGTNLHIHLPLALRPRPAGGRDRV